MATRNPVISDPDDTTPADTRAAISSREQFSDDDESSAIVDKFRAALASPSADALRIKVYKVNDSTGKLDYCRDMLTGQFNQTDTFERVRAEWGAGEFEFRLIGERGIVSRVRQSIANPLAPASFTPAPAPAPAQSSDALANALQSIAQTQQLIVQLLQAPKTDSGAEFDRMIRFAEVMNRNSAPAQQIDQMGMMEKMFGLLKGAKQTMRELNDDAPASDPVDPLMASIPKALELVSQAIRPQQPAQLSLPPSLIENRAAQHQPAPIPETATETPEQMMIRGEIEDLIDMAKRGESAEAGGDRIAERLPDELLQYMQNRYWFELVSQMFPGIKEHEQWMRAAHAHAVKALAEEGPEAP